MVLQNCEFLRRARFWFVGRRELLRFLKALVWTIEAEKLVNWVGCDATTTLPQDIRDGWVSAMDIAYHHMFLVAK